MLIQVINTGNMKTYKIGNKEIPANSWNNMKKLGKLNVYLSVHRWVIKNKGKASKCENTECKGISKNYDWALLKNCEYDYKLENFKQLCASCHMKYDSTTEKAQKARQNKLGKKVSKEVSHNMSLAQLERWKRKPKTHCVNGHPYENNRKKAGGCNICQKIRNIKYYELRKQGAKA